jgi:hypothetical protein
VTGTPPRRFVRGRGGATLPHSRSARIRVCDSLGGEDACFTARTRAPARSGKVTIEISQRSTAMRLRTRVLGSMRARAARKPIDKPSTAPARSSDNSSRARATSGMRRPRA